MSVIASFTGTAEEVGRVQAGESVRVIRKTVSHMPEIDPPYYVTLELRRDEPPVYHYVPGGTTWYLRDRKPRPSALERLRRWFR